ncbi:chitin binding domain-domain-containing protein [Clohesyomyces aquaticus]|uniref:Chitin binding domain-domain-containing protein n=1 Tax=Clohesyomyces aquaticus TaxID=1231657 RepID=A0A1Y2A772_9PLEO|nr:chitin binding domain-domain-containing protein [Clohesyomyces aquaticus]
MKSNVYAFAGLTGLISTVSGHGFVTSPKARMPGTAMGKACGAQVLSNQASDNYGNIQGEIQIASNQADYDAAACDIWLCKGYKLADNTANVQTYTAGQVVPMTVNIRAPHTGTANISIIKTSDHSIIGKPLISWNVYASNAATIPSDQKNFDITIPSDLGSQCSTAGDCVIQWWWDARSIDQTYESCVDFTVGSSGIDSPSPSSAAPASSAPASTAAPLSSAAATSAVASSIAAPASSTVSLVQNIQTPTAAAPTPTAIATSLRSSIPSVASASAIALPTAGTTLQDILDWLNYMISQLRDSKSRRHARDISRA